MPHPNFSDEINRNICQSEIEGGVFVNRLPSGAMLEIETANRFYALEICGDRQALISGHPKFCPEPVLVSIHGSTWGGSLIKTDFIGRGMHLEFCHPALGIVLTSPIREIRELCQGFSSLQKRAA